MIAPENSVASFEVEIARCKPQENGLSPALTMTLSPSAFAKLRRDKEERAGVRAGVPLFSFRRSSLISGRAWK
jgi:hypothetical protein